MIITISRKLITSVKYMNHVNWLQWKHFLEKIQQIKTVMMIKLLVHTCFMILLRLCGNTVQPPSEHLSLFVVYQ